MLVLNIFWFERMTRQLVDCALGHFLDEECQSWKLQVILLFDFHLPFSGVTRGGGGPPWVTPSRGVTPKRKKFFVGKFT